ncbi:centrosomal protein of 135 kDa isoform X1 [Panthera pardus]|uniref:Centrosomal protein 135 n=2 Tax=Panthera TaxID=9688 RepID=A0A8C9JEK2_PANTA|nr:centrosomal protein of 135 kDa isoform X1 [Panthera pardus]XP_042840426.1 centrosomal protein of 135 kDa [Panthera tigris]XP_042840427.1 centrosomal protein of 135 kDa [Panthera tigris]XP_049486459.1 centrosomal protein of 135 kDa [Panthera uncia]XP_049486461.1 centrosomal protein of 135 kDa [Panthera uncia]XP_049486462.1 centrosomal protein of 135 kDa [Panthera uncia]XP_053757534.1 centrosomal protein of 135 kDa isoform X1 [Panthera pardus]XP_053757535.1 centrosomal protein of 135 kDa is
MTTAAERKYINIRKRLDQLGYRQTLTVECLPLVEKLFSDLVHTTESLRKSKLSAVKAEKESANFDFVLEPYKLENARLIKENNELYLELMKLREQSSQHIKELKTTLKKCARETADLKFLNNQYVHKLKLLEKESKAKNERIQQLQEKNLHAVVQTPGGKKRSIAFRRQRMQIDEPVPPSEVSSYPVPQPDDPYIADLLQVADNRIQELQEEVHQLQEKLAMMESELRDYNQQIELREREIERLSVALDSGRSPDVLSLETRNKTNEKLIAHLNVQVDFLQQANKDLEKHIQELMETKETVTTEVVNLSNKNEKLCQELTEIDQLAQQLERHKEEVLETADKELGEAKKEIKRKLSEMRDLEETMAKLQLELNLCHKEKERLSDELLIKSDLETVVHQLEQEKQRLNKKMESFAVTERELTLEVERMRLEHGIKRRDKSPSRLDTFLKGIEEERDFYKKELERLQHIIQRRSCSTNYSTREKIPIFKTLEKGDYNSEVHLITRERDELQRMLERFERHMEDIQSNVKLLTAERDKLSVLYNEAQEQLRALRQESTQTTASHNIISLMEKEKELALSDLRRIMAEKEALKEKLKNLQEMSIFEKSKLEKTIEHLTRVNHQHEDEKCELKSKMLIMKETVESLENKAKLQAQKLSHVAGDSSHHKTEMNSLRLVNEQLQQSLDDCQHRLSKKRGELESAQSQIKLLEEKIGKLHLQMTSQSEEAHVMKKTIGAIDKEKDFLQETVDEKTEKIANLQENLANKEKAIAQMKITVSEYDSSMNQLKETLTSRDREISSLRRQLDTAHKELDEVGRSKEVSFKENRRLQDDLATMARENQEISLELEAAVQEKEEMKSRVHNYITEVSRWESLMAAKEKENQDLLDRFQMLHNRAEDWEVKAHQAEGESSSVRLELLSIDTERRHLRERVELLEKEIQEHINAHHAYESQISSMAKAMSRLEEELRHQEDAKAAALNDLSSLRELCIKLDSGKDLMTQQLNSKNLEFERVVVELENVKSEADLFKKQLASERHTIKSLESLLATNRDKEFHSHLTSHEKDTEIQLLKEKLTLSESKLTSLGRENTMLRAKVTQLQTDHDAMKRQISTERYERERAIQEMRRHGLPTPPLSSTLRSPLHSPEHISC